MIDSFANALFAASRYLLLVLSMFGYGLFLYKRFNIKAELIPVTVFSAITVIMYAAGLLNVMYSATLLVLAAGLFLFAYLIATKNIRLLDFKGIFTPGIIVFLVGCAAVFFLYRGARLYHYDNFSHWGLIVKHMWLKNRLPNFSDTVISYKTYPPGSAVFIYYITKIIGKSEGKMLIAQNILLLSCALTLFAFIKNKKRVVSYLVLAVSSFFMLTLPLSLQSLLVDTLLPLLAVANAAVMVYYRKDILKAAALSLPLITVTVLIKDSGILFAVFNIMLLLALAAADCYRQIKSSKKDRVIKVVAVILIAVIFPIACRYLWEQHVEMVFPAGTKYTSRHALSVEFFKKVFFDKTDEERQEITRLFHQKIFSLENRGNQLLIAFDLILVLALILNLIYRKKVSGVLLTILAGNIVYLVFQICLLFTYLLGMPVKEALYLAGYDRYNDSIICYIIGLGIICIVSNMFDDISVNKNRLYNIIIGVSIIAACVFGVNQYSLLKRVITPNSALKNSLPVRYDKVLTGVEDLSSKKHLIYVSKKEDRNYMIHLSRYKLFTKNFEIIQSIESEEAFYDKASRYDYLLVLSDDKEIIEILKPIKKKDSYIGHYRTATLIPSSVR